MFSNNNKKHFYCKCCTYCTTGSFVTPRVNWNCQLLQLMGWYFDTGTLQIHVKFYVNMNKFWVNMHEFAWKCMNFKWTRINFAWICMNLHEHSWKLIKISGFAVDIWAMWPVSEIGTPIFVAVFEGPIILLKICEVHLPVSSLHTL